MFGGGSPAQVVAGVVVAAQSRVMSAQHAAPAAEDVAPDGGGESEDRGGAGGACGGDGGREAPIHGGPRRLRVGQLELLEDRRRERGIVGRVGGWSAAVEVAQRLQ